MVFMPHWPKIIGHKPIDLGLDRIREVLARIGNPQNNLPPIIHVAGTNGKGSTVAFLKAILEAQNYKVHTYTSPHLVNFNERIVLNGNYISDDYLLQIIEEARLASADTPVTFFEGTTIAAFIAFAKNPSDVIILETGLGGRLDATNIIEHPELTIITPISLDHTEYLGPTITTIAREKAGIMKKNTPCVVSLQTSDAYLVLEEKAEELDIPLYALGYDWNVIKSEDKFTIESLDFPDISLPYPLLKGDHQIINASCAIVAAKKLRNLKVSDEAIKKGIQNAKWPARLQRIDQDKTTKFFSKNFELWLDGAHNESGAHVLANAVSDMWQNKKIYIICGITKGRDINSILKHFTNITDSVFGVGIKTEPSAYQGEEIAKAAKDIGFNAQGFKDIESCFDAIKTLPDEPAIILSLGSLYLASDILKYCGQRI